MLKRLTDTKHFYITCVILAIPSMGCSEASETAEDERSVSTPGDLEDATQDPATDPEPVSAPDATMVSADGPGDSSMAEPSGTPSANGTQPSVAASDDIDTQPLPGEQPQSPASEPPASEPQGGNPSPSDAGGAPERPSSDPDSEGPNEEAVQASCLAVASDPCETCVCESCVVQVDHCANTTGCPEILECVRESGCLELECYCGDSPLPNCLAGEGNGPCRAAVLSAPGGREPDALNPSGGPASDAALAVSECSATTCGDVCE